MSLDHTKPMSPWPMRAACGFFASFPVACFSLTVLTDIAYWQTSNLLWLHFSEWLLLAGLVFGLLAFVIAVLSLAVWKDGPSWPTLLAGIFVLLAATLNSFIHTADGWTAVVPYGLAVSSVTVLIMALTAWLGRQEAAHV
ncbi:DUF2231 domain-containing protein [Shinella zoogloeoides]|uniref:DUF2231 domain-containing protein n=1 Tax=Shinella zoogloeoides TaxID=352475 RepID=UPI0028B09D03|nr:DUF2231 domain-containing protein [Shinella zoogloeoides]